VNGRPKHMADDNLPLPADPAVLVGVPAAGLDAPAVPISARMREGEGAEQDLFDGQPRPAPASARLVYGGGPLFTAVQVLLVSGARSGVSEGVTTSHGIGEQAHQVHQRRPARKDR
jgi:hypothetical protein